MMNKISSLSNNNLKHIIKLKMKKYRDMNQEYIIEGFKLIEEAVASEENIRGIYISSDKYNDQREKISIYEKLEVPIFEVEESVFKKITSMQNSEGILAINSFQDKRTFNHSNILLLDKIQDPGNLGTMIRSGDAAGFNNILCSKGCVDIYNEKTIRATMGSLFHVYLKKDVDLLHEIEELKTKRYVIIGSELSANEYYKEIKEKKRYALVIGNESNGVSDEVLKACDKRIKIPLYGRAESLNASVAAGILMYHIASL